MPFRFILKFIKLESSAGIILFFATALAMTLCNSPLHQYYNTFQTSKYTILFINDGLMSIFFFLVGLEIKRELLEGELNSFSKAILPGVAAVGGMIVPAIIYLLFNSHDSLAAKGWAIPTATDIAFSLGILLFFGKRIPPSLKIFLMALAIFDDLGAIIIIATFYTSAIHYFFIIGAMLFIITLFLLNYFNYKSISLICFIGFLLWLCVLKSGIHPTIAGVILALFIPSKNEKSTLSSPLQILEHILHPWVAFFILPLFAFANAGVLLSFATFNSIFSPIPLGIAAGLFFGKLIGIYGSTMLAVQCKVSSLPAGITKLGLFGMSLIAGIGFTMSLFIGGLAFDQHGHYMEQVRVGVLMGSFLSALFGYIVLRKVYWAKKINV